MDTRDVLVASLASRQHGVVARWQLRMLAVDRFLTARRIQAGRWEAVTPRVIRIAGAPKTAEQRVMVGVLHGGPRAVASHEAAAWLWRLPGFAPSDTVILARDRNAPPGQRDGHRPTLLPDVHRTEVRGIPCTTLPRTIFDLAGLGLHPTRMRGLVNTVVTRSPAMLPALHQALELLARRGRPGIATMREVLAPLPPGTRLPASGLEARFLQLATNAGIRELECQVDVGGHSWLGRVDFAIVRLGLLIEIDSELHHTSPDDAARDAARDAAMYAAGWRMVLRVTEEDIWRRPHLVVQALRDAIRQLEAISA